MTANLFFGDSMEDPTQTILPAPAVTYPGLISAIQGRTFVNKAQGGSTTVDQPQVSYNTSFTSGSAFIKLGTNNWLNYGVSAAAMTLYNTSLSAMVYQLGAPVSFAGDLTKWSYAGTWTNDGAPWNGRFSNTNGSTFTVTFSGDLLLFSYLVGDGSGGGNATIKVDGVAITTLSTTPPVTVHNGLGNTVSPALFRQAGFGAGTHTLVGTVNGVGYFFPTWINAGAPNGLPIYLLSIPPMSFIKTGETAASTAAAIAAINSAASTLATSIAADGYSVTYFDAFGGVVAATELVSDGIHMNQIAHARGTAVMYKANLP